MVGPITPNHGRAIHWLLLSAATSLSLFFICPAHPTSVAPSDDHDSYDEGPSGLAYLDGHVLTETLPAETPPPAAPDAESFERTADDQSQSLFLRLPVEVRRRVYDAAWEDAGLAQHVYVKEGRYTHTACVTDHDAPDERQAEIRKIYPEGAGWFHHPVWSRRLLSSWVNHWRCEEAAVEAAAQGPRALTPFLPLFLTCKRVYLDIRGPLYERITFVLHRAETAINFLSSRNAAILPGIRSIHLSLNIDAPISLGRPYFPEPELPWHAGLLEWVQLRDRLPELESLRRLSIWLDATSQNVRGLLLYLEGPLDLDLRLVPFVRVSLPVSEHEGGRLAAGAINEVVFQPRGYTVVARGDSVFSQEPKVVPAIIWHPNYDHAPLYRVEPELYALQRQTQQQTQASTSSPRGLIGAVSRAYDGWKIRRQERRKR